MKFSFFILGFLGSVAASAQPSSSFPTQVFSARPMDDVVQLLEKHYGKLITYEEPILLWSGEVEPARPWYDPNHKWGLEPKSYGFALPSGTGTDPDVASVLQKIIAANNAQPIGPRFGLLTSRWGYHIVPFQSHDRNGLLVEAKGVLNYPINIPFEARTPTQHMRELMLAVKNASGTLLDWPMFGSPQGFDNEFLGRQGTFEWGASGSGRDALIDLFGKSKTPRVWSLKCQSSALTEDRFCALNTHKVEIFFPVIDR